MSSILLNPAFLSKKITLTRSGNPPPSGPSPLIPDSGSMLTNIYIGSAGELLDTQTIANWGVLGGTVTRYPWTAQDAAGYGSWETSDTDAGINQFRTTNLSLTGTFSAILVFKMTGSFSNTLTHNLWYSTGPSDEAFIVHLATPMLYFSDRFAQTAATLAPGYHTLAWGWTQTGPSTWDQYFKVDRNSTEVLPSIIQPYVAGKTNTYLGCGNNAFQPGNPGQYITHWVSANDWDDTAMSNRVSDALTFFGA